MNKQDKEQIRLLKQYNIQKFNELKKTLEMLIEFARDDLERLQKLEDTSELDEDNNHGKHKRKN